MRKGEVKDIEGQRFGKLVALQYMGNDTHRHAKWLCQCDCGGNSIALCTNLIRGLTKTCGCEEDKFIFGIARTRLYHVWGSMIKRCTRPKSKSYHSYGGRGITICDEWLDPILGPLRFSRWAILESNYDIETEKLSIERVDVNGNYCKENCTWIDSKKQCFNKQDSIWGNVNGEFLHFVEICKKYDLKYQTALSWLHRHDYDLQGMVDFYLKKRSKKNGY